MPEFMLYGCTGYTGRLVAEYAKSLGLGFILAGRSEDGVQALAAQLDAQYRVFNLNDALLIDASLRGVPVLLNCAGPFARTAGPLMEGCIRNGTHYLDIAAELDSYHLADKLDQKAREAKVMLMPGCGGSVAMLGCLASHALEGVERPASIDVALHVAGAMSRGSVASAAEGGLATQCLERVRGALVQKQDAANPGAATNDFDFGDGKGQVTCFPVTLPDLITIWKTTGVPNIRTFVHASGMTTLPAGDSDLASLPEGPTARERAASPYHACVAVTSEDGPGSVKRAVLHTVNGYTFTSQASVEAVRRALGGEVQGGFQTPAGVFGTRFVESVAGTEMLCIH
ncbi:Saccharopine dehydrogenase-domain-containing protein [Chaetomium tenue]|uniref:Saccharopine dehydrogenase-domain-containing protein n=1 Tax=Chaetomium tenue TaxID=1854479 RepID=A0ACB7PBR5_9PEZI|nr:Saccharopine dehydrogenase-domain-containing protein [Chaetomium globosum]